MHMYISVYRYASESGKVCECTYVRRFTYTYAYAYGCTHLNTRQCVGTRREYRYIYTYLYRYGGTHLEKVGCVSIHTYTDVCIHTNTDVCTEIRDRV